MPSLFISDIDEVVIETLKVRASQSNRSVEQEARDVLRGAVVARKSDDSSLASRTEPEHIVDLAQRLFGEEWGFDLELPPRRSEPDRPVRLSRVDSPLRSHATDRTIRF